MIEVYPEGYIDGPCPDITLDGMDIRSGFGYTILYAKSALRRFIWIVNV